MAWDMLINSNQNTCWNNSCRSNFSTYICKCWVDLGLTVQIPSGGYHHRHWWCVEILIHLLHLGLGDFTKGHAMSIATASGWCILILLLWPPKGCWGKSWEITLDSTKIKCFPTKGIQLGTGFFLVYKPSLSFCLRGQGRGYVSAVAWSCIGGAGGDSEGILGTYVSIKSTSVMGTVEQYRSLC